ncbi:MAG: hypothetical protein AB7E80_03240 [Hyphomicrobiaceae bacterium]
MKTLLAGILGLALLGGLTLGALSAYALQKAPASTVRAVSITRELSRQWRLDDIQPHFVSSVASTLDHSETERMFTGLSRLGRLAEVEDARQTGFRVRFAQADGFFTVTTIDMRGIFEFGTARVRITLRLESGAILLQHIHIIPESWHEPLPTEPEQAAPRRLA